MLTSWRRIWRRPRSLATASHPAITRLLNHVNTVTGYTELADHKHAVTTAESTFHSAQSHLTSARTRHTQILADRTRLHHRLLTHLQHQATWTPEDAQLFATLHNEHHNAVKSEETARASLDEAEAGMAKAYTGLVERIRARYHAEQVWSDWVRMWSTVGTIGVVVVNTVVTGVVWWVMEPRRRRELIEGVEMEMRKVAEQRDQVMMERLDQMAALMQQGEEGVAEETSPRDVSWLTEWWHWGCNAVKRLMW